MKRKTVSVSSARAKTSKTLRRVGGEEIIRNLPESHRLIIEARIARETGDKTKAKEIAKKAILEELTKKFNKEGSFGLIDRLIREFGLEKEELAKEAISRLGEYRYAREVAEKFELKQELYYLDQVLRVVG